MRDEFFQNLEIQVAFDSGCGFDFADESVEFEVELTRRYLGEHDPRSRDVQNKFV